MSTETIFTDICNKLKLGELVEQPLKLTGGYMHKMYRIKTDKGIYAIKMLNPLVMKRADAFNNFKIAETLEKKLQESNLPIVSALVLHDKKMQRMGTQYFYIFNFIDGKALKSEEIQAKHCSIIAKVLAKIHKIDRKTEKYTKTDMNIAWDYYIELAHKKCPDIATLIEKNKDLLISSQQNGNIAYKNLPSVNCVCHGDMDSKNVLWVGETPKIIDLECLHYSNPFVELFELALCWSGYEHCDINYTLMETFIHSYMQEYGEVAVDWTALYYNNNGRLEWLEYNIKRALMLECDSEEERLLGIEQVEETMQHVIYYDKIKETLLRKLDK